MVSLRHDIGGSFDDDDLLRYDGGWDIGGHWRWQRCGRADGGHLQFDKRARILRHGHGVLLAVELVDHVVADRAVLIKSLGAAALDVLYLSGGRTFNPITQNGAADQSQHGCHSSSGTVTDVVTDGATGDRTHGGSSARLVAGAGHLLGGADLSRYADLLNHWGRADHTADLLGH